MNRFPFAPAAVVALALAGTCLGPGSVQANDYRLGSLRIERPWAVATPSGAKVGAGYMTIVNEGTQSDRLIAMASPAAGKVTLHGSLKEGDVARMRALDKGIEIRPGETVELKPEGTHVMFEGLRAPLIAGGRVAVTLVFEKAGGIDLDYTVEPLGTRAPPQAGAHNH